MRITPAKPFKSRQYGLHVAQSGAVARIRDVLLTGNRQLHNLTPTYAIAVIDKAALWATNVRLSGNDHSGIKLEAGAQATISGILADRPRPRATYLLLLDVFFPQKMATLLGLSDAATARVAGARFSGGQLSSLAVASKGTRLVADGIVVDGTRPEPSKKAGGFAVDVHEQAEAVLRGSVFVGSHTVGLYSDGAKVTLENSVVRTTRPAINDLPAGGAETIADGLVVANGGTLVMRSSLVHDHGRVGVLSDGKSKTAAIRATLEASYITGCGFGLVRQAGSEAQFSTTPIDGNSSKNVELDGQLPVPPAPALIVVSGKDKP